MLGDLSSRNDSKERVSIAAQDVHPSGSPSCSPLRSLLDLYESKVDTMKDEGHPGKVCPSYPAHRVVSWENTVVFFHLEKCSRDSPLVECVF